MGRAALRTVAALWTVSALAAYAQGQLEVSRLRPSQPRVVVELDASKLKRTPDRLAWAPDGGFFLRSVEIDGLQNERGLNFVISPAGQVEQVREEPAWSAAYWSWKSGLAAPGAPEVRLQVEERRQSRTATGQTGADPGGGVSNPNRSDPTASPYMKEFGSLQQVSTITVRFKGQLILEAQDSRLMPGTTFSWAPAPLAALAFVNSHKRLTVIDRGGRKVELTTAGEVLLPAWSPDGSKIAYLQKIAKKKYALTVIEIG